VRGLSGSNGLKPGLATEALHQEVRIVGVIAGEEIGQLVFLVNGVVA